MTRSLSLHVDPICTLVVFIFLLVSSTLVKAIATKDALSKNDCLQNSVLNLLLCFALTLFPYKLQRLHPQSLKEIIRPNRVEFAEWFIHFKNKNPDTSWIIEANFLSHTNAVTGRTLDQTSASLPH